LAAAILASTGGSFDPTTLSPPGDTATVHRMPGPGVRFPCKVDLPAEVAGVQLWVSANRGRTWTLYDEIAPGTATFDFVAKRPGEYWFATRVKTKDGSLLPPDIKDLAPAQRVTVETGSEDEQAHKTTRLAEMVDGLDTELTRLELELIGKEIKRLAGKKGYDLETADKIDRLRSRLRDLRYRLGERDTAVDPFRAPQALPPVPTFNNKPAAPVTDPDRDLLPIPAAPAPGLPVAPPPRVPERP
jgi:hypothetical protein